MQCAWNVTKENMHFKLGFVIVFVVNCVVHPMEAALTLEQMNQTMLGLRAACQPRFNLDDDAIDAIKKGNFSNEMNVKCYVNCVLEMMNMVRRGKLNYESARKQVNLFMPDGMKEVYLDAIEQCKNSADGVKDNCEYSFTLLRCFYQSSPIFMFP